MIAEAISPPELVQPPYPVMHCNLILFQSAAGSRSSQTRAGKLQVLLGTEFMKSAEVAPSHSKNTVGPAVRTCDSYTTPNCLSICVQTLS